MVALVFKTSLGVVRSPEGSTPSLLRQTKNMSARDKRRKAFAQGNGIYQTSKRSRGKGDKTISSAGGAWYFIENV